ncbi:MAG TPA: hypothetical protein PK808_04780 [Polymorphobacter sp.]|jgi:uncharacterized membrane protein HdeD (DUF308 family)|nr:hypothetical protein [Polymorphobacter sp.]
MFAVRGVLAFALAALCVVRHYYGFHFLRTGFAIYAIADATAVLVTAFWRAPPHGRAWLFVTDALAGYATGLAILARPILPEFSLVIVIGLRVGIGGVLLLMSATRFDGHAGQRLMAAAGMASVLLAAALFAAPHAGLDWRLTIYLLVFGSLNFVLAHQLRLGRR